jgi:hypothetical protein
VPGQSDRDEALLRILFDESPDPIFLKDRQCRAFLTTKSSFRDSNGNLIGVLGVSSTMLAMTRKSLPDTISSGKTWSIPTMSIASNSIRPVLPVRRQVNFTASYERIEGCSSFLGT